MPACIFPRPAPERAGRRARVVQAADAPALPPRRAAFAGFSPGLFAKRPTALRRSACLCLPPARFGACMTGPPALRRSALYSIASRCSFGGCAPRLWIHPSRSDPPAALCKSLRAAFVVSANPLCKKRFFSKNAFFNLYFTANWCIIFHKGCQQPLSCMRARCTAKDDVLPVLPDAS